MTDIFSKIKQLFKEANIVTSLIYINVTVFIVTALINLVTFLFNLHGFSLLEYGKLPASIINIASQPWSILTHMFMHVDFLHILFNMLFLYWFGNFFINFFSSKHLRGVYILGGLIGAIFFISAYHLFPALTININHASLVGASAAVLAIVVAVATRVPNHEVRFLLLGSVKLKYIAIFVIVMALLAIPTSNSGGHIAHLGGALAGYLFARNLNRGSDLTKWINLILDIPARIGYKIKEARKQRKQKIKAVKNKAKFAKHKQDHDYNYTRKQQTEEIDRILDKIKESGYTNLTEDEKKALFNAGKK